MRRVQQNLYKGSTTTNWIYNLLETSVRKRLTSWTLQSTWKMANCTVKCIENQQPEIWFYTHLAITPNNLWRAPYGECLPTKRNCSEEKITEAALADLSKRFAERGYNKNIVRQAIDKSVNIKREHLLFGERKAKRTSKAGLDDIRLITKYSRQEGNLRKNSAKTLAHHKKWPSDW